MGKYGLKEFIENARKVHGDKYDYSKVEYKDQHTKVCIICPEHGEFWQQGQAHLKGNGCPKCSKRHHYTTEEWIEEARKVHGDKYDYSKVEYINKSTKVCIICPEHGEFWQEAHAHLSQKQGCKKCAGLYKPSTEEWIETARKVHGDKYDYSKVKYKNARTKVCIICPEHGEFWQTPEKHVNQSQGCPKCDSSSLEESVRLLLQRNNISFEEQYTSNWLKEGKGIKKLDFFLPDYNIGIECQGIQHFKQTWFGSGKRHEYHKLDNTQKRDKLKYDLCKEHNIKVLYYTDVKLKEYPYDVITNLDELIKKIKG